MRRADDALYADKRDRRKRSLHIVGAKIADLRLRATRVVIEAESPKTSVQAPLPQKGGFFGAPAAPTYLFIIIDYFLRKWSGRMDLNHRPPGPEPVDKIT